VLVPRDQRLVGALATLELDRAVHASRRVDQGLAQTARASSRFRCLWCWHEDRTGAPHDACRIKKGTNPYASRGAPGSLRGVRGGDSGLRTGHEARRGTSSRAQRRGARTPRRRESTSATDGGCESAVESRLPGERSHSGLGLLELERGMRVWPAPVRRRLRYGRAMQQRRMGVVSVFHALRSRRSELGLVSGHARGGSARRGLRATGAKLHLPPGRLHMRPLLRPSSPGWRRRHVVVQPRAGLPDASAAPRQPLHERQPVLHVRDLQLRAVVPGRRMARSERGVRGRRRFGRRWVDAAIPSPRCT
jgi:hypothetical protein